MTRAQGIQAALEHYVIEKFPDVERKAFMQRI